MFSYVGFHETSLSCGLVLVINKLEEAHYFTLELKTLLVEKLCVLEYDTFPNFLYSSFPPLFSPSSV